MLDMAVVLVANTARAGGDVVLEVYSGEGHTFQNDQRNASASRAVDSIARFIRSHVTPSML